MSQRSIRHFQCFLSLVAMMLSLLSTRAFAVDLLQIYHQAQLSDPVFLAAQAEYLSKCQQIPQARSALIAHILGTGDVARVRETSDVDGFPRQTTTFTEQLYVVSLNQPLIDFADWFRYQQAHENVNAAEARYLSVGQQLMTRAAKAYFDVLEAEDNLKVTQAEKRANMQQMEQIQERFNVGLETIASVNDAQAANDAVAAREIAATLLVTNRREELRKLTGHYYADLLPIKADIPLLRPDPAESEDWVKYACAHNLELIAARHDAKAAHININANRAGYLPTLDFVTSYSDQKGFIAGIGNTEAQQGSIGIALSIPFYQGGLIAANTEQAKHDYEYALAKLDERFLDATVSTRQAYNDVVAGISKIKADKQAVVSSQSSLDSTQAALTAGTRTIVDWLDSQRQLYAVQRVLLIDQYRYIHDTLRLKQVAGILCVDDLSSINGWLHTGKTP